MESRAYLTWNYPIRWGAHLIEADAICSKHRSKTHPFGAVAQGEILTNKHRLPHTVHSATQIAPQIDTQDRHTDKNCSANDEPLRQVGVDNRIEHVHQERSMRGFDARSNFELGLGHRERAWRPGKQLDDDSVGERNNVQHPQDAAAAGYGPTQQHPDAPKHMEKQTASAATRAFPIVPRVVPRPHPRASRSGGRRRETLGDTIRGRQIDVKNHRGQKFWSLAARLVKRLRQQLAISCSANQRLLVRNLRVEIPCRAAKEGFAC